MAAPGAVGWQFSRKGVILVAKTVSEDDLMLVGLDHGLEDITADEEMWHVTCDPSQVWDLKASLEAAKMIVNSATTTMLSANTVEVTNPDEAKAILKIMHELDDNDDVQDVYANFDISEKLMEEVG
jgi:transcriptional/translational regulatory protein YebC/TACO1